MNEKSSVHAENLPASVSVADLSSAAGGPRVVATGKPDAERAAEIRENVMATLSTVCNVMTEAYKDKFRVAFQLGTDAFGRTIVTQLDVLKTF